MRLGVPEIGVPDVDHTHEDGDVVLERGLLKVDVHVMESAEELLEDFASKSNNKRQAHRRVDRIAAADPIPKAKRVFGIDAKLFNTVERSRDGDKVLLDGVGAARVGTVDGTIALEAFEHPGLCLASVSKRLESREGLGDNDHERGLGIEGGAASRQCHWGRYSTHTCSRYRHLQRA